MTRWMEIYTLKIPDPNWSPLQILVWSIVNDQTDVIIIISLTFSIFDTDINNSYIRLPFLCIGQQSMGLAVEAHTKCPWEEWWYFKSHITVGLSVNSTKQENVFNIIWTLKNSSFVNTNVCVVRGVYWPYRGHIGKYKTNDA